MGRLEGLQHWAGGQWVAARGGGRFPWRPTAADRVRRWLLSNNFRLGLRMALSLVWVGAWAVFRQLTFPSACLAPSFAITSQLNWAPDVNMGAQLIGVSTLLFAAVFAPVLGSVLAFFASKAGHDNFAVVITVLGIVVLIPCAVLRAAHPNQNLGTNVAGVFGAALIVLTPRGVDWLKHSAYTIAAICLAASAALMASVLVLPTLAGDDLRACVGGALRGMGHQLSAYSSSLFSSYEQAAPPSAQTDLKRAVGLRRQLSMRAAASLVALRQQMTLPEECLDAKAYRACLEDHTDPDSGARALACELHPHPEAETLRGLLVTAQRLNNEAQMEPAALQAGAQEAPAWARVIADCHALLTRIAALRVLVEGGQLLDSELLVDCCCYNPLPAFRSVYAQLAALCEALGSAAASVGRKQSERLRLATPWQQLRLELAEAVDQARESFERHLDDADGSAESLEIRVVLFLVTLSDGIINAVADLEASLPAALGYEPEHPIASRLSSMPRMGTRRTCLSYHYSRVAMRATMARLGVDPPPGLAPPPKAAAHQLQPGGLSTLSEGEEGEEQPVAGSSSSGGGSGQPTPGSASAAASESGGEAAELPAGGGAAPRMMASGGPAAARAASGPAEVASAWGSQSAAAALSPWAAAPPWAAAAIASPWAEPEPEQAAASAEAAPWAAAPAASPFAGGAAASPAAETSAAPPSAAAPAAASLWGAGTVASPFDEAPGAGQAAQQSPGAAQPTLLRPRSPRWGKWRSASEWRMRVGGREGRRDARASGAWLRHHARFLVLFARAVTGVDALLLVAATVRPPARQAWRSRQAFVAALRDRRVQFAFKFWLGCSAALATAVFVKTRYARTRSWSLNVGYLTAVIVIVERVETATMSFLQRMVGVVVGGGLAYAILQRTYQVHPEATLAAVAALAFATCQLLHLRLRQTVCLTVLTLTSISVCRFPPCCSPSSSSRYVVIRLVNIMVGIALGMLVCWCLLPWSAADEQLERLAQGLAAAGRLAGACYAHFHAACAAEAQDEEAEEGEDLNAALKDDIILAVDYVSAGLKKEGVLWKRGLLATPELIPRLVQELRRLIHRLAALSLAVTQGPAEFGETSYVIHTSFVAPMHADFSELTALAAELAAAAGAVVLRSPGPEALARSRELLADFEACRGRVQARVQTLKSQRPGGKGGEEAGLTAADAVKLGSFLVAMSKVCDQVMLITRLVLAARTPSGGRGSRLAAWWLSK